MEDMVWPLRRREVLAKLSSAGADIKVSAYVRSSASACVIERCSANHFQLHRIRTY